MQCSNTLYSECSDILDKYFKKEKKENSKVKEYSKSKEKKKDYSKDRERKRSYGE